LDSLVLLQLTDTFEVVVQEMWQNILLQDWAVSLGCQE
jgi:hypothetical protein